MTVDEQLRRALETMPRAYFSLDADFVFTFVNAEGERILRSPASQLVGKNLFEAFPEQAGSVFVTRCRKALETGRPVAFEEPDSQLGTWFEVYAWPDGIGLSVFLVDISYRRSVEQQQAAALNTAQAVNSRLSFLSELAGQLTGARSAQEVFQGLVRTIVPGLADWATVVVPEDHQLHRVAAAHGDPALDGLAQRLVGAYPHDFSGPSPGVVVYLSGKPLRLERLVTQIVDDLDDSASSAAYGRALQLLGDGPGLLTPLYYEGDVVAVLTAVRTGSAPFSEADAALIDEALALVVQALELTYQMQSQWETASALQAATLPKTLPVSASVYLAAGYRAASAGSQVGGDWYDAFGLPTGRLALVVGDAGGHGMQAAALMAQMRNALRAHLFSALGPAESLLRLSRLVAVQEPDAFATVICAEIDPVTGVLTWASAGHPAPILVRGDGTSTHLRGVAAPPIGWVEPEGSPSPPEYHVSLQADDRLLLFTDGLYERRRVHPDIGLAHLMILAEQTRQVRDATQACETILEDILTDLHEDDLCLLIADFRPTTNRPSG